MQQDIRFGYDKVMFSLSTEPYEEYPFDKEAFKNYKHRLKRIRGPGMNIWGVTWNWSNKDDGNLIKELLALGKSRTMYVWVNLMRQYMQEHDLTPPDNSFDDNICPPDTKFNPNEFHSLLNRTITAATEDYKHIYKVVFNETCPKNITARIHELEVVGEKINATVYDMQSSILARATAKSMTKFHDDTGTIYLNPLDGKSQIKFYQKNPSILRQEITLSGNDAKDLSNDIDDIGTVIAITDRVLERFNMTWFPTMTTHTLAFDERLAAWALFLNLDQAVLKNLIELTSWKARKGNQNLTRSLVRRKLLKKVHKGKYAPTYYLQMICKVILADESQENP